MPNGKILKMESIVEMENNNTIHFEQYVGFVLDYKDTFFNKAVLVLDENYNDVGKDVLNEKKINKLKLKTCKHVKLTYILPDSLKQRSLGFENWIKDRYSNFDREVNSEEGFELIKNGKTYLKITFYNIAAPNYSVLIFPN